MAEEEKDTTEDIENARQAEDAAEEPSEEADEGEGSGEGEEAAEEKPKEKKKKKVVRRRKTKKERENALTAAVRLAVESGKVDFGSRSGLAASADGKAKLFVVANNTPPETRAKVEGSAKKSDVPVIEFEGSSVELGSVCGKPFPVSVLSVFEEGTSNIMDFAKKK
ncbi:50S ribosomal protein L30e [Candidatus Micrarchaeota archaeon]|nr:50S ribosomal protein L30e [Candidatus Micrarchaeota archaeon]